MMVQGPVHQLNLETVQLLRILFAIPSGFFKDSLVGFAWRREVHLVRLDDRCLVSGRTTIRLLPLEYTTRYWCASSLIQLPVCSALVSHRSPGNVQPLQYSSPHFLPCAVVVVLEAYLVCDILVDLEHELELLLHLGVDVEAALLGCSELLNLLIIVDIVSLQHSRLMPHLLESIADDLFLLILPHQLHGLVRFLHLLLLLHLLLQFRELLLELLVVLNEVFDPRFDVVDGF